MNINIQPLSGHPFTIKARLASRSPYELLGISQANNKRKPSADGKNVQLMHPPILLINEGGGEKLLNRESIAAQLDLNNKCTNIVESLVVYLIEKENLNGDLMMLTEFLFGPLQRIYHEKKDTKENLNWKIAISLIEENKLLKSCIEKELFNGENLATRHYMQLLRGTNLSESTIGRRPGVKVKNKNTKNNSETLDEGKEIQILHCEKSASAIKKANKNIENKGSNFYFNKSLEIIKKAAERGEKQFSHKYGVR